MNRFKVIFLVFLMLGLLTIGIFTQSVLAISWGDSEDYIVDEAATEYEDSSVLLTDTSMHLDILPEINIASCTTSSFLVISITANVQFLTNDTLQFRTTIWNGTMSEYYPTYLSGNSELIPYVFYSFTTVYKCSKDSDHLISLDAQAISSATPTYPINIFDIIFSVVEYKPDPASAGELGSIAVVALLGIGMTIATIPATIAYRRK